MGGIPDYQEKISVIENLVGYAKKKGLTVTLTKAISKLKERRAEQTALKSFVDLGDESCHATFREENICRQEKWLV